ncbi:MAG: hypothetical protein KBC05_20640, partial [Candidatus Hydrogenedentes bacterium]|nr:hypothetical protein [Candidatus Hydrogenedentota bacterium]
MREKCVYAGAVFFGLAAVCLLTAPGAWARDDLPFGGLPASVPVATEDPSMIGNTIPSISEFTVSSSAPNDLEVTVNLSTANLAYLEMWLCHADNSHGVQLVQPSTLSGTALTGTVFDDKAAAGITAGTAPYTGHFRPAEPLNMVTNSTSTFKLVIKNYDRNNEIQVTSAIASYLYWPDDLPQRGASVFSATDLPDDYIYSNLWPNCGSGIKTAEANIQVPAFVVRNVAVRVSQAGRCDRMEIFLQHVPSGTTRKLKAMSLGGAATVMTDTLFTDYADENMTTGTEPFTGKFLPSESISVFNGLNAQGEWRVRIVPRSFSQPDASWCEGGDGDLLAADLIFNDPALQYNCSLAVPWFVDNSGVAQGVPPQALGVTSIITLHNNRSDILPCAI